MTKGNLPAFEKSTEPLLILLEKALGADKRVAFFFTADGESRLEGLKGHVFSRREKLQMRETVPGVFRRLQEKNGRGVQFPEEYGGRMAVCPFATDGGAEGALCAVREEGCWEAGELQILEAFSSAFSLCLKAGEKECGSLKGNWGFNTIMDHMNANIYVTDMETDEILFMNRTMKETFGIKEPEGKICWQVLQKGMSGRCTFCPVDMLKGRENIGAPFTWEEKNTLTGRVYENFDSLMQWMDGRTVHFQHSVDMTENRKLYEAASTDELTGLLSRWAGRERLGELLAQCRREQRPLTVCMFDINDLKHVNDTHGHLAGDHLLVTISQVVEEELEHPPLFMRLSGDEFLTAQFAGMAQVNCQLRRALDVLRGMKLFPSRLHMDEFCYGLITLDGDREPTFNEILTQVDEKLYEQKKKAHIELSLLKLGFRDPVSRDPEGFVYDKNLLYDALMQSTDDYIYVCNMKTGVFRYPAAMVEEFDLPSQVISNAAAVWGAKVHEHDKRAFLESNQEITDGRTHSHNIEYRARNRKGEWVWLRCRGHVEQDENGEPALFAGIITNLGKKNKIDPLTGLFNKYEFESQLRRLLDSEEIPPNMTIMLFGIDDLKRLNSLYDRTFGDEVIRIVGQRIQSLLPDSAMLYKLDGDEFGVLIKGASRVRYEAFYKVVQEALDRQMSYNGQKFYCTVSCGCVIAPRDGSEYEILVKFAHYSLEYAKYRGKNRLERYSAEILSHMERSMELIELLGESVRSGFSGFSAHFQPICTPKGEVTGAETLARWSCDRYGSVPPDEFISLLESSGLIRPFGRWIFEQAVAACAEWCTRLSRFTVGVNLSWLQLEDPDFASFMLETLQKYGLSPCHIVLELTESYLASNLEAISRVLQQLRGRGLRIAMDDFGTGYSSLGILKQAPIDLVKIDRTFVKGILENEFDRAFIRLGVELCRIVGISVCLEGVERQEELEAVVPMNLDFIQGFLFGRPVPPEEMERFFPERV